MINSPFVSVIIPVYNDAIRLKKCLEALEQQSYPSDNYEVIVIDNASDEEHNIKGIVNQFSQAYYTYETKPGSYAARNKGLSIAKGDIIAFTDADCIPTYNWLENGINALLSHPDCGLVGGKIEIFYRQENELTPVEVYEKLMALPQQQFVEENHYGATANVFTWKRLFKEVGLFNTTLKSGGDCDWGNRVYSRGYQLIYADNVKIYHPARSSFKDLYKRTRRYTGGHYDLMKKNAQSQKKFYQQFFLGLVQDLAPPVNFTRQVFSDNRLSKIKEKIIVSLIFWTVRYLSAWEKLRLQFGGTALRE
ncbi:glycosyltransferase [Crocosphaera sp.]|uniref:glycosyltransferase n=1 Tax=Crocosphaera sp. TaxID=2729996 RepID=UPI003F288290|nr:glycosyltransferase [Crocosphaera sp.]